MQYSLGYILMIVATARFTRFVDPTCPRDIAFIYGLLWPVCFWLAAGEYWKTRMRPWLCARRWVRALCAALAWLSGAVLWLAGGPLNAADVDPTAPPDTER